MGLPKHLKVKQECKYKCYRYSFNQQLLFFTEPQNTGNHNSTFHRNWTLFSVNDRNEGEVMKKSKKFEFASEKRWFWQQHPFVITVTIFQQSHVHGPSPSCTIMDMNIEEKKQQERMLQSRTVSHKSNKNVGWCLTEGCNFQQNSYQQDYQAH